MGAQCAWLQSPRRLRAVCLIAESKAPVLETLNRGSETSRHIGISRTSAMFTSSPFLTFVHITVAETSWAHAVQGADDAPTERAPNQWRSALESHGGRGQSKI